MSRKTAVIIMLFVVNVLFSRACGAGETVSLTLEESIDYAFAHNRNLLSLEEKNSGARYKVQESLGSFFPQVSASFNYTHMDAAPSMEIPAGLFGPFSPASSIATSLADQKTAKATVQQALFTWGRLINSYRQSGISSEISVMEYEKARQQLRLDVVKGFYGVITAREIIGVTGNSVRNAEVHLENTKRNFKAGTASEFDVLRAEVQLANIRPQLIKSGNGLKLAVFSFKNLLGIPDDVPVAIRGELSYDPSEYSLEEGVAAALSNRLELRQLEGQKKLAKIGVDLAASGNKPTLSFLYNYQFVNGQTSDPDEWQDSWNAMLNLSVPVFDGLITSSRVKQARSQLKQMEFTEADAKQGIKLEIEQIYYDLKQNEEIYTSQEKNISQAQRALDLANARYREGMATSIEVMDAQQAFMQAEVNMLQSLYDYAVAQAKWEKATGKK